MALLITNSNKKTMKLNKSIFITLLVFPLALLAQENKDVATPPTERKLERAAFESTALIDNQTNVLNTKGTIELTMNHRFGSVKGTNDMIGIWAPANIRLGVTYGLTDCITIGFGTTKDNRLQDFNLKGALLRQTRDNAMPVSVTYYGNAAMSASLRSTFETTTYKGEVIPYRFSSRLSFFNQLIIARRFNSNVSFQIAPSWSHVNFVESPVKNDLLAVAVGGRVKINPSTSVLVDYSQPLNTFQGRYPLPGVGLGVEFSTGSHAFQLFVTNYKSIVQQQNYMFNQNDFFRSDYMIGFNITRLWHM
jgi:hypothetical protein